jgi:hypothetical protein
MLLMKRRLSLSFSWPIYFALIVTCTVKYEYKDKCHVL